MRGKVYFDAVQQQMVEAGFTLASRCQITTDDAAYHLPVNQAVHTNLCFHKQQKRFVLSLQHNEYEDTDGVEREYWCVYSILQYPHCWLANGVPGYLEAVELPELKEYNRLTSRYKTGIVTVEQEYGADLLKPSDLVAAATTLLKAVEIHILDGVFHELTMSSLSPLETFPDAESIFWERFDVRYFKYAVAKFFKDDFFKEFFKRFAKK